MEESVTERERDEWGGIGAGDWMQALFYQRGLEQFLETDSPAANHSCCREKKEEEKKAQAQFGCSKRERERESS